MQRHPSEDPIESSTILLGEWVLTQDLCVAALMQRPGMMRLIASAVCKGTSPPPLITVNEQPEGLACRFRAQGFRT